MNTHPNNPLLIEVAGTDPVPQGSLAIGTNWQTGKQFLKHDQRELDVWRKGVAFAARRVVRGLPHFAAGGPLLMGVVFRLSRPRYGRPGSRTALDFPTCKQDQDKLLRAVRDALTGIVYADDGQVLGSMVETANGRSIGFADFKRYVTEGELPGCTIRCARLVDLLADDSESAGSIAQTAVKVPVSGHGRMLAPESGQAVG